MSATFFDPMLALRPLRPRQQQAISAIRQAIREGHKRIVVQAPTGFGKTLTAAHIIAGALSKGTRPLFCCPAINLVNQTLRSFEAEGISDIGVIQAQHERTDWTAQTQIASVQTLIRRALPEVHFILIDECHSQFDKLNEILDSDTWKDKLVIGLSATPWAKGMGLRWTKLVIAATTAQLIDEGWLCPFRVFAAPLEPDLKSVKIIKGEFDEGQLSAVMDKPKLVADVVDTWLKKGELRSTFLFGVDRAHAKSLQNRFLEVGVPCGYIDGNSDDDERRETFRRFRERQDLIISSVGCLTTGIDEDVHCIIDAQPLAKSEIRHVQKIGRGLRISPNDPDKYLLILDHAGNTQRIGMVDAIHHERLDCRKPGERGEAYQDEKKEPKPKKCEECHFVMSGRTFKCPRCGHMRKPVSNVETVDGELVEMTSKSKKSLATMDEKQSFYSELLAIKEERGYKDGWLANQYRNKFNVWPKGMIHQPKEPSQATRKYVQSQMIRYAKGREKANAAPLHEKHN